MAAVVVGQRPHILAREAPDRNSVIRHCPTSQARPPPHRTPACRAASRAPARRRHHRLRSEEHTSELQSLMRISYAVICMKNKNHYSHHPENTTHHYTQHTHNIITL